MDNLPDSVFLPLRISKPMGLDFCSELGKNTERDLWPGGTEDNGIEGYLEMSRLKNEKME